MRPLLASKTGPPRHISPRRRLRGKGLGCAAAAARGEDGLRTQGDSNGILFLGMRERRRGAEPVQKVKKRSGGIASPTSHSYATGLTATPHAASGDRQLERFTNKRVGRGLARPMLSRSDRRARGTMQGSLRGCSTFWAKSCAPSSWRCATHRVVGYAPKPNSTVTPPFPPKLGPVRGPGNAPSNTTNTHPLSRQ